MGNTESFKSILEAALGENAHSANSPAPEFSRDAPLGIWVTQIHVCTPPQTHRKGLHSYRRFRLEKPKKTVGKKTVNTASKKREIPSNFDWKDEFSTAKMIFNTYGEVKISNSSNEKDLKLAYKKLLFLFHPDQYVDGTEDDNEAHERFLQLQRAYRTLKRRLL